MDGYHRSFGYACSPQRWNSDVSSQNFLPVRQRCRPHFYSINCVHFSLFTLFILLYHQFQKPEVRFAIVVNLQISSVLGFECDNECKRALKSNINQCTQSGQDNTNDLYCELLKIIGREDHFQIIRLIFEIFLFHWRVNRVVKK